MTAGDLPPVGARVRTTSGDIGTITASNLAHIEGLREWASMFVRWDLGGGMWVTADEIEEVLTDG